MEMDLVYDLRRDGEVIAGAQQATLTTENFGLEPTPALFGTSEWWQLIETGELPTHLLEGHVSRVYWGSMGDWPEFELVAPDDQKSSWTREGDITKYFPGLRAKLSYVVMRSRQPNQQRDIRKVLEIWIERSRLRSCDVAPGPGGHGFRDVVTLYRPVGDEELSLIEKSEHTMFPPRLAEQPIFYPVTSRDYAHKIAREWNSKDQRSGFVGYITRFHLRNEFLREYQVHEVDGPDHGEYWIPADDLDELNDNLVGRIDVEAEIRRDSRGSLDA